MNEFERKIKYGIARTLSFVPTPIMLRVQYAIKMRKWLHLNNPKRFTEKIQWYKAYYHNEQMLDCTDKYLVRKVCEDKLGTSKYLNELYQVCKCAEEIDFDSLPKEFVIKTTDGGNGDNIYICHDKGSIDRCKIIALVNGWRNKRYDIVSREWAYRGARDSQIIVEKLLVDSDSLDGSIDDYKFLCFNGVFRYLWVDKERYTNHRRGFWDRNLNFLEDVISDHPTFDIPPQLPANISEMIMIAEKLAQGYPFARIDLYNIQGHIVFGEITFYPWSGYVKYTPDTFDYTLGVYFEIDK